MKKIMTMTAAFLLTAGVYAQDIQLPAPDKTSTTTLMQALDGRHSERAFADKTLSTSTLSTLLWAAEGVNRQEEKKLTVPSCRNLQEVEVYVIMQSGAYRYDPYTHTLKQLSKKDLRESVASTQKSMANAPVFLITAANMKKFGQNNTHSQLAGAVDQGYVSQNICLACEALGLVTVPRMTMDTAQLKQELGLDDNWLMLINHPVGYPAR